jgi:hypothetical protein
VCRYYCWLVGLHVLLRRLTGDKFRDFAIPGFPNLLDEPTTEIRDIYVTNDDTSACFIRVARDFINSIENNIEIVMAECTSWPPISTYLKSQYFNVRGHLKHLFIHPLFIIWTDFSSTTRTPTRLSATISRSFNGLECPSQDIPKHALIVMWDLWALHVNAFFRCCNSGMKRLQKNQAV